MSGSHNHTHESLLFDDFFNLGFQETTSPFLTPASRAFGANLTLKAALIASVLLLVAFILKMISFHPSLYNLLLIFVYFLAGIPALIESIEDIASFEINIDILMTLAAFSSVLIGSPMEGALLLVLFAISGSLEDSVTMKAKQSIQSLQKLSPTKATVITDKGSHIEKSVKDIKPGTTILVKAGEIVPLDGKVIAGISSVNLVHLTGENMPVTKQPGDAVPGGGKNLEGALTLLVENSSQDSTIAKIVRLVTEAQDAKPNLQRWFDRLSQAYAMAIIMLAVLFTAILPWLLDIPLLGVEGSLYRSLAFLIAASPCALIIALPIAYLSAISNSASHGILLKGGIALDALASCKAIAFDKTGTVTLGELECIEIKPLKNSNLLRAHQVALVLERNTVHPIASAVISYCSKWNDTPLPLLDKFTSLPGYGLQGEITFEDGNQLAYMGKPEYIADKLSSSDNSALDLVIEDFTKNGDAVAVLLLEPAAANTNFETEIYVFRFQDTIRPKMKETIASLKSRGIETLMLTGDHHNSAHKIAKEVGIDEYRADLKPEDKLRIISELSKKQHLAMVGDGVNDAPALARATIGICMGKVGSTSAIEAADVVLLNDNIEKLDWLFGTAYLTKRIVKQNVILATLAILIASVPALAGIIPLWLAVIMHEGGTVLVGLNSLRLLRR